MFCHKAGFVKEDCEKIEHVNSERFHYVDI